MLSNSNSSPNDLLRLKENQDFGRFEKDVLPPLLVSNPPPVEESGLSSNSNGSFSEVVQYVISLDPGLIRMGLAIIRDGTVILTTQRPLVPDYIKDVKKWINMVNRRGTTVSNFYAILRLMFENVLKTLPEMGNNFENCDLIVEANDNQFTRPISYIAPMVFKEMKGSVNRVRTPDPTLVWQKMRPFAQQELNEESSPGLNRKQKKALTQRLVKSNFSYLPSTISDDEADALLNYLYYLAEKKRSKSKHISIFH